MANSKKRFIGSFRGIHSRFSALYSRFLVKEGLTLTQYTLLNLLSESGKVSMKTASDNLHITKPAVTYLADQLEAKGLLKRVLEPRDRRVFLLEIQPKGQRIVQKAEALSLVLLMKSLNRFASSEKSVIGKFYDVLTLDMDRALKNSLKREKK